MAKEAIQRNQQFLEKVLSENESLVSVCDKLKQENTELKQTLSNYKSETLKSMEPRIKGLLDSHKAELEKQRVDFLAQLDSQRIQFNQEKEQIRLQHVAELAQVEDTWREKLKIMKSRALSREKEIKDAASEKISAFPKRLEEAKAQAKKEEEAARSEWQQMVTEKIRAEFEQKANEESKMAKDRQEKLMMKVVSKLEIDSHEEAQQLEAKLQKEEREHSIVEQRLSEKIRALETDNSQFTAKIEAQNQDIEALRQRISQCKCEEYKRKIKSLERELAACDSREKDLESALEEQKKGTLVIDQLKKRLGDNEAERQKMAQSIGQLKAKVDEKEKALSDAEAKHSSELSIVSERVKQTVEKKDKVIAQLLERIEKASATGDGTEF